MNTKALTPTLTLSITASLAVLSATLTSTALAQPAFYPIGNAPGLISEVFSLSRDGKAAGGENATPSSSSAPSSSFRWTLSGGREDFQTPIFNQKSYSVGRGISADGSTVVGWAGTPAFGVNEEAFRRRSDGTVQLLGHLANFPAVSSVALAANADGSVIVGYGGNDPQTNGGVPQTNPFRWTASGGMQPLAGLPGGNYSQAYDVSDDGKTVVGTYAANSLGSPTRAFVWREGVGSTFLTGPTGVDNGQAYAVSANGSIVAGEAPGLGGCRWVNGVAQGLGLVGDWTDAIPKSISDDGSVIVGRLSKGTGNSSSFVWTEATGMMESVDYLRMMGVLVPDKLFELQTQCVSGDGLSFGGFYVTTTAVGGGYVCTVPSPSTLLPLLGVLLSSRRRR